MHDTARYALDNLSRSIKHAGYHDLDEHHAPRMHINDLPPTIMGLDAQSLKATQKGIDAPIPSTRHQSDVLALRLFGSGIPEADDAVVNCAGFSVPAPTSSKTAENERNWSIYYVADDVDGEPTLYCKYLGNNSFSASAIARGVESFQVLYGIHTAPTTMQFLSATDITALDASIKKEELPQKTHWKKISAIKVAMLVRGERNSAIEETAVPSDLFNETNQDVSDTDDKKRQRKILRATVQLRNPPNSP
jgi:type IV pilus assembly protein PilW